MIYVIRYLTIPYIMIVNNNYIKKVIRKLYKNIRLIVIDFSIVVAIYDACTLEVGDDH